MKNIARDAARERAREAIDGARAFLLDLSHRIHATPELAFQETRASTWLSDALTRAGLAVESGVGDVPTAFVGRAGSGALHVAICAEYDALPVVGHACGHNVIAAAAVGTAIALAPLADELEITLSLMGTPAEEGGGGKILMLERGVFDGVHAALMVHPGPVDSLEPSVLAAQSLEITYQGKEAHAAAYPERGVNAADALVVAQAAIGLLRQHLQTTDRVHGIVTKGGDAPNIIPSHTAARYMVRAQTLSELDEVRARVLRCFEAGAVATGARLDVQLELPYAHMVHDARLASLYRANAEVLGRRFVPEGGEGALRAFSTDMGNVSLAFPSIHPIIGIDSLPAVNHQPEFTAACISPAADRAVLDGALAMAWTVIDLATMASTRADLTGSAPRPTAAPGCSASTLGAQHQDVLVDDVGHERARIPVGPESRAGLVPDEVALGHEARGLRPSGKVCAREAIPAVLVRVAHDDHRVPAGTQHAQQLPQDPLHPIQVRGI